MVYIFKKALFLLNAISLRFSPSAPTSDVVSIVPTFPIPDVSELPIFADNVIPSSSLLLPAKNHNSQVLTSLSTFTSSARPLQAARPLCEHRPRPGRRPDPHRLRHPFLNPRTRRQALFYLGRTAARVLHRRLRPGRRARARARKDGREQGVAGRDARDGPRRVLVVTREGGRVEERAEGGGDWDGVLLKQALLRQSWLGSRTMT